MKKILALAIAVIMICACAFTVSAAETALPDQTFDGWWTAWSQGVEVTEDGVTITFHAQAAADATQNYQSPSLVVHAGSADALGTEYWVQRADAWGWCYAQNVGDNAADLQALGYAWEYTFAEGFDWANFVSGMIAGVEATVDAKLEGANLLLTYAINGVTNKVTIPVDTSKPVFIAITGEKCSISNVKVTTPDPVPAVEQLNFETAPVDGTAYKLGVTRVNANKVIYLSGVMDGYYFGTTENIDEAADVYVENVEGGFKMYILVEGAKQYINIYTSGKYTNVEFSAENAKVFAYNAECKNLVTNVDGTDFYLGCYKEFTTISASKTSYITAENTCVSQFPAGLVAVEVPGGDEGGSDETGDMIGVVIALLAVSGMGITVLKKK